MSPARRLPIALLILVFPAVSGAAAPVDSLVPLPEWRPWDKAARLRLTPHAITVDPIGRPWILDRARGRVGVLSGPDGAVRSLSVVNTCALSAFPFADIAASGSYLFLLDPSSPRLTLLDLDGYVREEVDLASEVALAGKTGFSATRLLVGRSGDLWLIDSRGEVLHFDRRGRFLDAPLEGLSGLERPKRIGDAALAPDDAVVVLDPTRPALLTLLATGGHRPIQTLDISLIEPVSMAIDGEGEIYILEGSGRIRVFDPDGQVLFDGGSLGGKTAGVGLACVTADGTLMRADPAEGSLRRWRIVRPKPEDEEN